MSAERSSERTERSETQLALGLALGVTLLAALGAALLFVTDEPAGWVAAVGAVLVGGGVFIPQRGVLSGGTLLLATGSLVATGGEISLDSLMINAVFAIICMAVLVGADLSYVARRSTVIAPAALEGFVGIHVAAAAAGVVLSTVLLSVVVSVTWPTWLLIVPAATLLVGSIALVRSANRYQHGVNLAPQAAAPSGMALPDPRRSAPASRLPPPPRPADRVTPRSGQVPPPPPRPADRVTSRSGQIPPPPVFRDR